MDLTYDRSYSTPAAALAIPMTHSSMTVLRWRLAFHLGNYLHCCISLRTNTAPSALVTTSRTHATNVRARGTCSMTVACDKCRRPISMSPMRTCFSISGDRTDDLSVTSRRRRPAVQRQGDKITCIYLLFKAMQARENL